MQNQELRNFVATIIKEKNLTGVEQDVIDALTDDLAGRLETQINRALIDALDEAQFAEFQQLVDANDTHAISTFFTDKKLPVQEIVTEVMARFRAAYLGS